MIPALFWATVRERLTRPLVVVLVVVIGLAHIVAASQRPEPALADPATLVTLLIAAGSVGRDVSSGALALIFTRPVTRSSYVFTKWLALALAATVLSCLCLGAEEFFLAHKGHGSFAELARVSAGSVSTCFGLSAVLVCLSCLVPGYGDVAIWVAGMLASGLLGRVSARAAQELGDVLAPSIDWLATFGGGHVSWFALCTFASSVILSLALAVVLVNRKELSYAAG